MRVLGVNAVFHDPAAALIVDGAIVAAAEEERFTRRKHGKSPVPFSTWELPEQSARWCLARAGVEAGQLDAVAYSYEPRLAARMTAGKACARCSPLARRASCARRCPGSTPRGCVSCRITWRTQRPRTWRRRSNPRPFSSSTVAVSAPPTWPGTPWAAS